MIRLIFLLAISLTNSALSSESCKDYYNPIYFEESSDELNSIIEEYFIDKNITFLPTIEDMKKNGLVDKDTNIYMLPNSISSFKEINFPIKKGIWKYETSSRYINTTHLLIKEQVRLSELEAINTYNDLLGAYWNDYSVTGYEMILEPQDPRIRYKDRYFELNVKIYGLLNDATNLPVSRADLIFRDYTAKVNQYISCMDKNENTIARR